MADEPEELQGRVRKLSSDQIEALREGINQLFRDVLGDDRKYSPDIVSFKMANGRTNGCVWIDSYIVCQPIPIRSDMIDVWFNTGFPDINPQNQKK